MNNKTTIITSLLLAALSNCLGMELPKEQPLIKGIECAALFTTLAKQAREVLLNEENDLDGTDDEKFMAADSNPLSKKRRSVECPICKKNVTKLTMHMHTHTGEKPFKCDQCNYACAIKAVLKKHLRKHTGEKPYHCDQCDYSSAYSSNLARHKLIHPAEKSFKCNQCHSSFVVKNDLTQHMLTHTEEKTFECDQCNYSSTSKSHLTKHIRIHTGEKPFQCDQCNYSSTSNNNLVRHKRKHS